MNFGRVFDLLEEFVVVLGAIMTASLVSANSIHKRMTQADKDAEAQAQKRERQDQEHKDAERARTPEGIAAQRAAIVEQRRILERRRDCYFDDGKPQEDISQGQWDAIKGIENQLIVLAKEEAKLHT